MTHMTTWLATHYVAAGKFLLYAALTLLIATLGTALPQLGLVARWPRRLATWTGLILIFLGGVLALAKTLRPHVLQQFPWAAAMVTSIVGVVLAGTASAVTALFRRTTQQRLRPMADAAWRIISRLEDESKLDSYIKIQTPNGLSAVNEILARIRKKQARPLLLVAPSGTGKTCTLMSIAAQCRLAFVESRRQPIITVYIDIAQFAIQPARVPLRDYIVTQVARDAEFVRILKEAWADKRTNVIWLFLFDNADRAVMRWGPREATDAWSAELIDFLGTNPTRFRAVLTGRDLSSFTGERVEFTALSQQTRAKFMSSHGVTPAQLSTLVHEKSFRQYADNLGWLDLVSRYLTQVPGNTPNNFHDLMDSVIMPRITSIASGRSEFSDDLIVKIAQKIAVRLKNFPSSYGIKRTVQVHLLSEEGYAEPISIELVIDELIRYDMMIRYLKEEDEIIEFKYDSIRSYFAINAMLGDGSAMSIDELLKDPYNTTIAISLLQSGHDELVLKILQSSMKYLIQQEQEPALQASAFIINRMLSSAHIALRSEIVEEEDPSPWTTETYHLLHVLDAGLNWRPSEVPEVLREATDTLLAEASPKATPRMQEQMLDIQALATNDVAAACCAAGLRSSSGWLVEAATRKVMSRRELLNLLAIIDRIRFMISVAFIGLDSWTSQHIDPEYSQRLRFTSFIGVIAGPLLFVVYGIPDIIDIATNPSQGVNSVFTFIIALAAITTVAATRRSQGVAKHILAACIQTTFAVIIIMAGLGFLGLITSAVEIVTGHLSYVSSLLTVYTLLWPMSVLYYLAIEPTPILRVYVFPFNRIAIPLWSLLKNDALTVTVLPTKRQLAKVSLSAIAVAALFTLNQISQKAWRFGATTPAQHRHILAIATWTAWIIVLICVAIIPITDYLSDWRWIRQWKRAPLENSGDDVMAWLYSLRTRRGTERMIAILARRQPTPTAIRLLPSMYELQGVLEWAKELSSKNKSRMRKDVLATIPSYLKPHTKRWIRRYDRKYPGRLATIANSYGPAVADYVSALNELALMSRMATPKIELS